MAWYVYVTTHACATPPFAKGEGVLFQDARWRVFVRTVADTRIHILPYTGVYRVNDDMCVSAMDVHWVHVHDILHARHTLYTHTHARMAQFKEIVRTHMLITVNKILFSVKIRFLSILQKSLSHSLCIKSECIHHIHTHTQIHTHIYAHSCTHTYTHAYTHTLTHTHTHTHTYTHTNTHTEE